MQTLLYSQSECLNKSFVIINICGSGAENDKNCFYFIELWTFILKINLHLAMGETQALWQTLSYLFVTLSAVSSTRNAKISFWPWNVRILFRQVKGYVWFQPVTFSSFQRRKSGCRHTDTEKHLLIFITYKLDTQYLLCYYFESNKYSNENKITYTKNIILKYFWYILTWKETSFILRINLECHSTFN